MEHFQVTLIVPDALKISHAVRGCLLEDTEYYKISKLSLEHLITPDFYVSFIKSGKLHPLTCHRHFTDLHRF